MKLSEAIRLGAMLKPQGFGEVSFDSRVATCALGAAKDANGGTWRHEWDNSAWSVALCPVCGDGIANGDMSTPAHLNDVHRWPRERIADWVESIEAQHAPQPEVGQQNLTEALR